VVGQCNRSLLSDEFDVLVDGPTVSSIESLDEVESSPRLPMTINRSHDSGLAASDQPFNDDSSEMSERRQTLPPSLMSIWTSSIACGKGLVLKSILLPMPVDDVHMTSNITRRRSSKATHKPSKQFLEREKLIDDTTDESDHHQSSVRSSATIVHTLTQAKLKRSKSLSRHSSVGSVEQQQKLFNKESRRLNNHDGRRAASVKQIHLSSDDEYDDDDDDDDDKQQSTAKILDSKSNKSIVCKENHSQDTRSKILTTNVRYVIFVFVLLVYLNECAEKMFNG
jgi:hypothetical protein